MATFGVAFRILLTSVVAIASAEWVQLQGPYGGETNKVAVCGDYLFAATKSGVFRSGFDVKRWEPVSPEKRPCDFTLLAASGPTLFVATDRRLYRSIDFGMQWTVVPIAGGDYNQVKAMCAQEQYVFVVADRWVNGEYIDYVYRMNVTDTAMSDSRMSTEGYLTVLAARDSVIVAGGVDAVFLSLNAGNSWERHATASSPHMYTMGIFDSTILAGDMGGLRASGIHEEGWNVAFPPFRTSGVRSMMLDNDAIIIGRYTKAGNSISRSFDRGATWDTTGGGLPMSTAVNSLQKRGAVYYAATNYGVFHSNDDGGSWMPMNEGLPVSAVTALESFNGALFAGTPDAGVFISHDHGDSWAPCRKGLSIPYVNCLRSAGNYLYAGVDAGGVHIFSKLSDTWLMPNDRDIQRTWYTKALAANNTVIYALTGGLGLVSADAMTRSSWGSASGFSTTGSAYSAGAFGNGVICWADAGLFRCGPMYPERPELTQCVRIVPDSLSPIPYRILSFVVHDDLLFGATAYNGVFVSSDSGRSWDSASTGLDYNGRRMHALVATGNALIACSDNGIYRSTDHGATWVSVGEGRFDSVVVRSLHIDGNFLYAGTQGYGLWRRPLAEMVAARQGKKMEQRVDGGFRIRAVNNCIQVSSLDPAELPPRVDLYTLSGKNIRTAQAGRRASHNNTTVVGPLAPGGYLCRTVVSGRSECRIVFVP